MVMGRGASHHFQTISMIYFCDFVFNSIKLSRNTALGRPLAPLLGATPVLTNFNIILKKLLKPYKYITVYRK